MGKTLLCRLHRHRWAPAKTADGETYERCSRCGTDHAIDLNDPTAGQGYLTVQGIKDERARRAPRRKANQ